MLNQDLAYILCTVIAVGFIDRNNGDRQKTEFIFEMERDRKNHERLAALLEGIHVPVAIRKQDAKPTSPYILAKPSRMTWDVLKGAVDDLVHQTNLMEAHMKEESFPVPLRGAYIGGMSSISGVEFVGPSDLYLYEPHYREVDKKDGTVGAAYGSAKTVSNCIIDYLKGAKKYKGENWRLAEGTGNVNGEYQPGELFGSVHGMTRSLIHYAANMDKAAVYLELALGEDTCKVASCIPCSIFMSSKNVPATATHFGRGDNWNFPEDQRTNQSGWETFVKDCYRRGAAKMARHPKFAQWQAEMSHWAEADIPGLFLESLTFESSFLDKMFAVLG